MYTRAYTPNVVPRTHQMIGHQVAQQFISGGITSDDHIEKDHTPRRIFVSVSSAQRDLSIKPSASDFEVRLPKPISNVYSARILQCTIPKTAGVLATPVVYLRVNNFNNIRSADDTEFYTSMSYPVELGASSNFVQLNSTALGAITLDHNTPRQLQKIERFKVQLFDVSGNPIVLPDEVAINAANQVTLLVELSVFDKNQRD